MPVNPNVLTGNFTGAQASTLCNNFTESIKLASVATGTAPFGGTNYATYTSATCKTRHVATVSCTDLQLEYSSLLAGTIAGTPEVIFGNRFEIKVSIELVDGTLIPVFFGGRRLTLMVPGALTRSDPIGVSLEVGTVFYIRCFINRIISNIYANNVGEPGFLTANQTNLISSGSARGLAMGTLVGAVFSTSTGVDPFLLDSTDSGSIPASSNVIYLPVNILGVATAPTYQGVAIIGSSISAGSVDTASSASAGLANANASSYPTGFWTRAFGESVSYLRIAQGGETLSDWITNNTKIFYRLKMIRCNTAVIELGTNDLMAGASVATIQANLLTLITLIRKYVDRVWVCTVLPRSSSTDGWTTISGQTPVTTGTFGQRSTLNDWLRAGGAGAPCIDIAAIGESSLNSGYWRVGAILESGTATGGGGATIADTGKAWTVDQWIGYVATNLVTGQSGFITSNTATVITCAAAFSPVVGAGNAYSVTAAMTADTVHPSAFGHRTIAAGIDIAAIVDNS